MTMTMTILPPQDAIQAALLKLSQAAQVREDHSSMRAYDNAAGDLLLKAPMIAADSWLIPSSTRSLYHRVQLIGGVWSCNCEQGLKKGGMCRHLAAVEGIQQAWEDVAELDAAEHPALDVMIELKHDLEEVEQVLSVRSPREIARSRAAYEAACAEMDELTVY